MPEPSCAVPTLYASSNTLAIWLHLACSEKPTMLSALTTLTKGNPLSMATVAARAAGTHRQGWTVLASFSARYKLSSLHLLLLASD